MLKLISDASSIQVALWAFGLIFGGAVMGFVFQLILPEHHFSSESKDAAKLGAGLVATLAALILGLLISSTKGTFDQINTLVNQVAANYIHLDRLLANYGPETTPIRAELHNALSLKIQEIWPEECKVHTKSPLHTSSMFEKIAGEISALQPATTLQTRLQNSSLQLEDDLLHERWMIEVVGQGGVPPLLLIIPVVWITFLTFLYALFSPRNLTVITVLFFCSLSIAGAIFLIDEMSTPLDGKIKVSSAPLRLILDQLQK
ncbi:MAG: hypothetical protein WCP60_07710 [bacterium]